MECYLYTFSKKQNSTKRPGDGVGTLVDINFLSPTDMLNPNIELILDSEPYAYNYAFIWRTQRYYFVSNWTWDAGRWIASLSVDPLASWRTEIGQQNLYITRSSNTYDGTIYDTTYPTTATTTITSSISANPWYAMNTDDIMNNGCIVMGIVGGGGITNYYTFTYQNFLTVTSWLFSDSFYTIVTNGWSTTFDNLKTQFSPAQYITSVMWYPVPSPGDTETTLKVGWWDTGLTVRTINLPDIYGTATFSIPSHPQAARGTYLNYAPFSRYKLVYPPFGEIDLSSDWLHYSTSIGTTVGVDLRTGLGVLWISNPSEKTMLHLEAPVGVPFQISQVLNQGMSTFSAMKSGIDIGLSVASGDVVNTITGVGSAIEDIASKQIPSISTIGSNGGITALRGKAYVYGIFHNIVDEDLNHRGRPLCANKTINTIPGYILVADADISIPCTDTELLTIKNYLEGGFFYE